MKHVVTVEVEIEVEGKLCGRTCQFTAENGSACTLYPGYLEVEFEESDGADMFRCPACLAKVPA
jgi:hypothetical protein